MWRRWNGNCFYKGLSPEYQQMLAHKVDGENPVTYSKLLLTAWKLERWVEVRNPLFPKTPTTRNSNVSHSHSQGNLFPSQKLKGNHTFTAWPAAIEDHKTEEDSGPKPDREKEYEGTTGDVGDVNPSLGHITQFANVVELYQKRNCNCFGCGSPDHLVKDCLKEMGKTTRKVGLNLKEGMAKKRSWVLSEISGYTRGHPRWCPLSVKTSQKAPFLNPRPTHALQWAWKHSQGQDWWWGQLGSLGEWFHHQCSDFRNCPSLFFGSSSLEQPGRWYSEDKWVWGIVFPALWAMPS